MELDDTDAKDILLVDDSDADAELTRRAFATLKLPVRLHRVRDGIEALQFLRREGEHRDAREPSLVLLDLNMPRMNGFELLERLESEPGLAELRVVVLTSSQAEQDRLRAEQLHCEAYLVKPVEFRHFVEMIRALSDLLLRVTPRETPDPIVH